MSTHAAFASPGAEPARRARAAALPIRRPDFEALLAPLFHHAIAGRAVAELQADFCRELAKLLALPLVQLGRALDSGAVMVEAASREGPLWLDFQRLPERWDSGIASQGPAGLALAQGAPALARIDDDGLSLWRLAAAREHVCEVLAVPLPGTPRRVLELFFATPLLEDPRAPGLAPAELGARLAAFLDDLDRLARTLLVARALEQAGAGAFITDLDGTIAWCNPAFTALSGYAPAQVLGRKPSVLRSGHQGLRYYRELWETLRTGKTWTAETVDRARDGAEYSILQTVSPVQADGRVTHYVSIHQDIGRQRRERAQLQAAAQVDPATGLLTRAAFEEAARKLLQAAADSGTRAVLVALSLRGLRGDARALPADAEAEVMAEAGRRLLRSAPALCGHLGGCEFAMLFADDEAAEATLLARLGAISDALQPPVRAGERSLACDPHFGNAHFPADGLSLELLWDRADRRLANEPFHRARRRKAPGDMPHA